MSQPLNKSFIAGKDSEWGQTEYNQLLSLGSVYYEKHVETSSESKRWFLLDDKITGLLELLIPEK